MSDWSSDVCSSDLGFSAHFVVADCQLENSHPIKLNREQKPSHSNQTLQNGAESIFRGALRERETDFLRGKTMALRIFKRSEEHTSELPSLMRISYAVLCLKKKTTNYKNRKHDQTKKHITT